MSTPIDVYKHAKLKSIRMLKMQGQLEDYLIILVANALFCGIGIGIGYWLWN